MSLGHCNEAFRFFGAYLHPEPSFSFSSHMLTYCTLLYCTPSVDEADSHLTGQWSDLWESRLHQCKFSCSLLSFLFSPFFSPVARETRGHLLYASSTLTNTSCILSNCDLTSFVPQHPTIWRTTRILWAKGCRYTQVRYNVYFSAHKINEE